MAGTPRPPTSPDPRQPGDAPLAFLPEATAPLRARAHRVVEAQHRVSTLELVDTVEEQEQLEELIDRAKPTRPAGAEFVGLHYLLLTPFRYPPLRHGSRFGLPTERGIWYGSEHERTALAEAAYYRLLFLDGSRAGIERTSTEHSLFHVGVATAAGIDLTAPPYDRSERLLASPSSYAATRPLGAAMRAAGIEAFWYRSARDPGRGRNLGVFTPRAFTRKTPPQGGLTTWACVTTRIQVVFRRRDPLRPQEVVFEREAFTAGGRLPNPGLA